MEATAIVGRREVAAFDRKPRDARTSRRDYRSREMLEMRSDDVFFFGKGTER